MPDSLRGRLRIVNSSADDSSAKPRLADYREVVYSRYVSAFKGAGRVVRQPGQGDPKLAALFGGWLAGVDRSGEVLDLGCGDGGLLLTLRSLGFEKLAGVDCSGEQVARAREVSLDVVQGDLMTHLEAQPIGRYTVLLLFDVIEHLNKSEILRLLELVGSRLKPGGVFIAHCPNGDSPMHGTLHAGDFTHETLMNPQSARHLCTLFGLEQFEAREHLGS